MNKIQKPKGTKDILPKDIVKFQYIEKIAKEVFENYGYQEIRVPVFESTELYQRGVGETTDVVQKEMYTFEDKGGRSITLRPEGTAGVVRAYLENGMASQPSPVKMWYNMPMYRYEKMQKGRYREFRQIGAELFGSDAPTADAEMIIMASTLFQKLNLNNIRLELNSIGCPNCRKKYQEALREYARPNLDKYCESCQSRFEKNPMRMIDCKERTCKELNKDVPSILDYLCEECKDHFEKVKQILEQMNISFQINDKIVRGLDYYSKTVFEFISNSDGLTVLGGGRYDGLVEELGGQRTGAIGFALGLERLVEIYEEANKEDVAKSKPLHIYIASIGDKADIVATNITNKYRTMGYYAQKDVVGRSLNSQLKYADKQGAKQVIIIGEDEVTSNIAKIKDMKTGEEKIVHLDQIDEYIKGE